MTKPARLDLKTFDLELARFEHHFPQVKFEDRNATAWYDTLKDELSPERFIAAVELVCKKKEWFPTDNFAGQVLQAAKDLYVPRYHKPFPPERQLPESTLSAEDQEKMDKLNALASEAFKDAHYRTGDFARAKGFLKQVEEITG